MTRGRLLALALLALCPLGRADAPAAGRILTLDEAVGLARQNQPAVRQARAGTMAASARADEARAALLPRLDASAGYTRSSSRLRGARAGPDQDGVDLRATASMLVWDFGLTPYRWSAARSSAEAQRESERATVLQAILAARSTFFSARAAKDLVQVARETLANQEAHLKQIEGFVQVGTRPPIDLAAARTARANAEVQLIGAENGYETAKAQLLLAMGAEPSGPFDVANETLPPVEGEDRDTEALLPEALRARPDVAALEQARRSSEASLSALDGTWLPSLGVSSTVRNDGQTPVTGSPWNWSASATLSWNLFQGGLNTAQAQEARANLDTADAQLAGLRLQVRLDVEQARLSVRAAKGSLRASAEALTNAREQLRLAEGRYQTGAGSVLELSDAQVALTAASAQAVQADYGLASARAQLLRALGRVPATP